MDASFLDASFFEGSTLSEDFFGSDLLESGRFAAGCDVAPLAGLSCVAAGTAAKTSMVDAAAMAARKQPWRVKSASSAIRIGQGYPLLPENVLRNR